MFVNLVTGNDADHIPLLGTASLSIDDPMLIYDNEDPEKRITVLATQPNLLLLKRSPSWYVDATFRVTPQLFYQLLVIYAEIPNHQGGAPWVFPCVYMLLTHKDTDIYLEGFIFLNSLLDFSPQTIMVDFEKALRNSLSQVFPSAVVDGCYFHFCQAVRLAHIVEVYDADDQDLVSHLDRLRNVMAEE